MHPAFPTQHLCSRSESSFIPKNHQTWEFQLLIPHKQTLHTEINYLPVMAKIISQPGIQLCVASIAVANRLSWAAWKICLTCSTFKSHLNTDHTCDWRRIYFPLLWNYMQTNPASVDPPTQAHPSTPSPLIIIIIIINHSEQWSCFKWPVIFTSQQQLTVLDTGKMCLKTDIHT